MDDMVKIIALLCTWYNRRENLIPPTAMMPEDWKIVSYDQGMYDSFSATVTNRLIGGNYFLVSYDGIEKVSQMSQYRLVSEDEVKDSELIVPRVGNGG